MKLFILLFITIMSSATQIPMAVEVPSQTAQFNDLDKLIRVRTDGLRDGVRETLMILQNVRDGLTGLNLLNVVTLQRGVGDLGEKLDKLQTVLERLRSFEKRAETLTRSVDEHSALLKPLSELARDKQNWSEQEAKNERKRLDMHLAKMMAQEQGIGEYEAYAKLTHETNWVALGVSSVAGFMLGSAAFKFSSKL